MSGLVRYYCIECRTKLPVDRFDVARGEKALGTKRGRVMAARLESDLCLKCSDPTRAKTNVEKCQRSGGFFRPEGQAKGLGKTRS